MEFEQSPTGSTTRTADLLIRGLGPKPLAVDTSIWTHALLRDVLDEVVSRKVASSKAACVREGWQFAV